MAETLGYERDPRLTRLETTVVRTGETPPPEEHTSSRERASRPFVVLADTILYPEGGGQPADRGRIAGIEVLDVHKVDGEVRHVLAGPAPSGEVTVELDWARRFDHMQQHTAQHLLTAIADTRFGWSTTAFHLGETVSDIELDTPAIDAARLAELEEAVAAEIRAARPVATRRVSPEAYAEMPVRTRGLPDGHSGSVRLVEIEGIDLNTCGGTHCASTAELEALKLLGTESLRGGTRLFYVAGARLRRTLGAHHERSAELRALLGVPDDELADAVGRKLDHLKEAQRALRHAEEALAVACAEALAAGQSAAAGADTMAGGRGGESRTSPASPITAHWDGRGLPFLQRVARELERLAPERVVFLTGGEGEEGFFLIAGGGGAGVDVAEVGARVAELLGGRGGGSGRVYQGRASKLSRRGEAEAVLRGGGG